MSLPDNHYLSAKKAAALLDTTPNTLRRWEAEGKIKATKTTGGHRRYSINEVNRLKTMGSGDGLLSAKEATELFQVTPTTLRRWEKAGKISAIKTVGGHRRYVLGKSTQPKKAETVTVKTVVRKEKEVVVRDPKLPDLYSSLPKPQHIILKSFAFATLILFVTVVSVKSGFANRVADLVALGRDKQQRSNAIPQVLQASSESRTLLFGFNIPVVFRDSTNFESDITFDGLATFGDAASVEGDLDVAGNVGIGGSWDIGGTVVSASAAEINYLSGATITQGAIVYANDTGITSTTAGSSGQVLTSAGTGTPVWVNQSDLDVSDASTLDGIDSSGFLRSDASDSYSSGTLTIASGAIINIAGTFQVAGTAVTSSATELNILDGATVTASELNYLDGTTVTTGGVLFGDGTKITQDATNFFWDDTNNRLGIGTASPTVSLDVAGNFLFTGSGTFSNNTTSNVDIDLTSTGDFTVSNSGTAFVTFNSNGNVVTADGLLLDLSSITHNDAAAQGLKLPQATSLTAISGGGEGYLAYNTSDNTMYVFDGSNWNALASGSLFTDGGTITYLTDTAEDLAIGGTSSTSPLFLDVSASALSLNPYGVAAGNTGEIRFTELAAGGTEYTGFKAPDAITTSIVYTLPDADATASNQVLASSGAGVLSWIDVSAGSGALWTDGGTTTYLTSTTDDLALGGSGSTSPLFVDVSASALTLNPYDTLTGTTGEIRFTELAAGGTNYTGFKAPDSLAGNLIYTLPSADGAANQVLATNSSGTLSWIDLSAGAGGLWTRSSTNTYLTNTTDELIIGGSSPLSSSKVSIDGDTDQIQLLVQGNGTQTTNVLEVETSAAANLLTVDNSGNLFALGNLNIDGASHDIAGTLNLSGNALTSTGDLTITPTGGDVTIASAILHAATLDNTAADLTLQTTTSGNIVLTPVDGTIDVNASTLDLSTQTTAVTLNAAVNALNFDSNTLSIDASSNRVGIGNAAPTAALDVTGSATVSGTLAVGVMNQVDAGTCNAAAEGRMYYDKGQGSYYFCNGTSWFQVGSGADFYSATDAAVADGGYVEVAHNQNTSDLLARGWVNISSIWTSIDEANNSITDSNEIGDGTDGALSLTSSLDINTTDSAADSDDNGSYADGIAYKIDAATASGTVVGTADAPNGLVAGDEVLLINLQGASGDIADVGNYEFLTISSISGNEITFTSSIQNSYDGTTAGNQKVVIQRIPQFTSVTLTSSGSITASAWDGLATTPTGAAGYYTGIVAFRATGTVSVASGTSITTDSLGYRGGNAVPITTGGGRQGESTTGNPQSQSTGPNEGGGGGGNPSNSTGDSGGGGGHGIPGTPGYGGSGGGGYGYDGFASKIYYGSGGGSGGSRNTSTGGGSSGAGGRGGGIIYIVANDVTLSGTISADGQNGSNDSGSLNGSGGGGAGGSIKLLAKSIDTGEKFITVLQGVGGTTNYIGGTGGTGRVNIKSAAYIIEQTDANTVRLYNYSGGTQNLRLDVITSGADLAEWYPTSDPSIEAGDIVSASPNNDTKIIKSAGAYDRSVLGIISTKAGVELSAPGPDRRLVGLAGRVPTKIDPNSEPIKPGDFITSSSTPGKGMKATKVGWVVGTALEGWSPGSGRDKITVFINPTFSMGVLTANGEIDMSAVLAASDVNIGDTSGELGKRLFGEAATASESGTASDSGQVVEADLFGGKISISEALEAILSRVETVEGDVTLLKGQGLTASGSGNTTGLLYSPVVADTLSVGGITIDAATNSIDAVGVLSLQSLGLGKVDVYGNMELVDGVLVGNDSFRGTVELPAGKSWVRIDDRQWNKIPQSITANASYDSYVWVEDITEQGFTLRVKNPPSDAEEIYWLAIW